MAKERTIICKFYECEHNCARGRDAVWKSTCQICPFYVKKPGAKSSVVDKHREKLEKIRKKDLW